MTKIIFRNFSLRQGGKHLELRPNDPVVSSKNAFENIGFSMPDAQGVHHQYFAKNSKGSCTRGLASPTYQAGCGNRSAKTKGSRVLRHPPKS
jgi:hypothetical protein